MNDPIAHVKGQTLANLLLYAESQLSKQQYLQLIGALSPDEKREVSHVLPTNTYPVRLVNKLTIEAAKIAGRPLAEFARAAGRFNADAGIKGVYRVFARVMTAEALLGKATTLWSTMNLAGQMTMQREGSSAALVTLTGYTEPEEVMCFRITGWMEQLLIMTGSKNAKVDHTQCVTKGAKVCEWRVEW